MTRVQAVILNLYDVMLTAMHVVPRVETTLYTGWSSSKTATFLQPIVLDTIVNAFKAKVTDTLVVVVVAAVASPSLGPGVLPLKLRLFQQQPKHT